MTARKRDRSREDKTLAMRVLEGEGIPYELFVFPDTIHDAEGVAQHTGVPAEQVYKTLVVEAQDPGFKPMLIMIAANQHLDLKKVAGAVGARKVRMARHEDAETLTGLQVGGISTLALLNRGFAVYIDEQIILFDRVLISAGKRGINIGVPVEDLIRITHAQMIDAVEY